MRRLGWRRGLLLLLLGVVMAHFLALTIAGLMDNTDSNGGDQGAYLLLGLAVRARRALTDGNRHPLYPLLIAPWAARDWTYFTVAKLISLLAGVAGLLLVALGGQRQRGAAAALGAAALLGLNAQFVEQTPQALGEALLLALTVAAWFAMGRALEQPERWRRAALAGALAGAAYWAKGATTLTIGAFVLAAALVLRGRLARKPILPAFLGALLLVMLPLMAYNLERYGQPLYNHNSAHAMWYDSWDDNYLPLAQRPTMASFLATHSLGQIAARQGRGMLEILPTMAEGWALRELPASGWLFVGLAAAILIAGAACALRDDDRRRRHLRLILGAALVLCYYLFHAWFAPVTAAARFFLPIAPILYLLCAETAANWAQRKAAPRARRAVAMAALALVGTWSVYDAASTWIGRPWVNSFAHDRAVNRDAEAVVHWINARAAEGIGVLWGPSHTLPKWMFLEGVRALAIPDNAATWADMLAYIQQESLDYVVLDKKMYSRRDEVLTEHLDKSGNQILYRDGPPPGWTFALAQRGDDADWFILAPVPLDESALHAPPTVVRFGEAGYGAELHLVGYAVETLPRHDGREVAITLLWEAPQAPTRDLTAYVHLLRGTDRVAQADGQPLGGMYPTSRWRAGERLADRYTLLVGNDVAGEARVLVGFYDLEDQSRPKVRVGDAPGDDGGRAYLLPEVVRIE